MNLGEETTRHYLAALERFAEAANDPAVRYVHPLQQGQMLILDNNRFGHGRLPLSATGPDGQTNPRTLWSATVA